MVKPITDKKIVESKEIAIVAQPQKSAVDEKKLLQ